MGELRAYNNVDIGGASTAILGDINGSLNIHVYPQVKPADKIKVLLESLKVERSDARLRNITNALDRTCRWIFSNHEFKTWLNTQGEQQGYQFLWIKGKPGSGKSTMMKELFTWAKKTKPGFLIFQYFFNARSAFELEKSSIGLYRSLIHMLLTYCPAGLPLFVNTFASKEEGGQILEEWSITELQNFLIEFVALSKLPPLILLVDALDEGDEDDVRDMIDNLMQLIERSQTLQNQIFVCLSSRHYPTITIENSLSIVLEQQTGHQQDIKHYLAKKLKGKPGSGLQDLMQQISDRSNGVFLWVVLTVNMLNKLHDQGRNIQFQTTKLSQMPRDLHQMFDNIVNRETEDMEDCITLFQWILYSTRPMYPSELIDVLDLSPTSDAVSACSHKRPDDESVFRRIVHCSRGLVEYIDYSWNGVQFIHETVRDFLLDTGQTGRKLSKTEGERDFATNFQPDQCHLIIAKTCLQSLINLAADRKAKRYESAFHQRLSGYAAKNWWKHARLTKYKGDDVLLRLALDVCSSTHKLQTWTGTIDEQSYHTASLYLSKLKGRSDRMKAKDLLAAYKPRDAHKNQASALYYAATIGLEELVLKLLQTGARVDSQGGRSGQALQAASEHGHQRTGQVLLEAGADVNVHGGPYGTALMAATVNGHEKVAQSLLKAGASVDTTCKLEWRIADNLLTCTALCAAAVSGQKNLVQILLDAKANVNETVEYHISKYPRDSQFCNSLIMASAEGHEEIVQILLDHGVEINNIYNNTRFYRTALEAASLKSHLKIVKMLVAAGAREFSESEIRIHGLNFVSRGSRDDFAYYRRYHTGYEDLEFEDY